MRCRLSVYQRRNNRWAGLRLMTETHAFAIMRGRHYGVSESACSQREMSHSSLNLRPDKAMPCGLAIRHQGVTRRHKASQKKHFLGWGRQCGSIASTSPRLAHACRAPGQCGSMLHVLSRHGRVMFAKRSIPTRIFMLSSHHKPSLTCTLLNSNFMFECLLQERVSFAHAGR